MIRSVVLFAIVAITAACGADGDDDGGSSPPDGGRAADSSVEVTDSSPAPDAPLSASADAGCVPTSPADEVCDGIDNDCNGLVDDRDASGDGIFDCSDIALFGTAGFSSSSNFVAWLTGNGTNVERVQTDMAPLTADLLNAYDLIVLDRLVREYDPAEATLLREWVERGGGLMVMTGYNGGDPERSRPNGLLAEIGLEYLPGLQNGPVIDWTPHPISTAISSVTFNGGYVVGEVAGVTGGANTVVGSLPAGPVAIAQERGAGRVFVWGDEWIQFDSEWSTMPMITALWGNITSWLVGLI